MSTSKVDSKKCLTERITPKLESTSKVDQLSTSKVDSKQCLTERIMPKLESTSKVDYSSGLGRGKLSPEPWVARRSFLPSRDASAFSRHTDDIRDHLQEKRYALGSADVAADCDGRRQEVGYTHCRAEVAADCDGRRQDVGYTHYGDEVAADCDGRRQEVGYTHYGAEVAADCDGRRQERLRVMRSVRPLHLVIIIVTIFGARPLWRGSFCK